jgi:hypothetical protein
MEGSIARSTPSLGGMCCSGGMWFEGIVFTPDTADRTGEEEPAKKVDGGPIIRGDIYALPTPTSFGTPRDVASSSISASILGWAHFRLFDLDAVLRSLKSGLGDVGRSSGRVSMRGTRLCMLVKEGVDGSEGGSSKPPRGRMSVGCASSDEALA